MKKGIQKGRKKKEKKEREETPQNNFLLWLAVHPKWVVASFMASAVDVRQTANTDPYI